MSSKSDLFPSSLKKRIKKHGRRNKDAKHALVKPSGVPGCVDLPGTGLRVCIPAAGANWNPGRELKSAYTYTPPVPRPLTTLLQQLQLKGSSTCRGGNCFGRVAGSGCTLPLAVTANLSCGGNLSGDGNLSLGNVCIRPDNPNRVAPNNRCLPGVCPLPTNGVGSISGRQIVERRLCTINCELECRGLLFPNANDLALILPVNYNSACQAGDIDNVQTTVRGVLTDSTLKPGSDVVLSLDTDAAECIQKEFLRAQNLGEFIGTGSLGQNVETQNLVELWVLFSNPVCYNLLCAYPAEAFLNGAPQFAGLAWYSTETDLNRVKLSPDGTQLTFQAPPVEDFVRFGLIHPNPDNPDVASTFVTLVVWPKAGVFGDISRPGSGSARAGFNLCSTTTFEVTTVLDIPRNAIPDPDVCAENASGPDIDITNVV